MIKVTDLRTGTNLYVNANYIERVSITREGHTVISTCSSSWDMWVRETTDEVMEAILNAK